jgi:hypothetical protein
VEKTTFQKEAHLKDLVVQLLHEKDFSNYDVLDSLFSEIKEEFQS